MDYRLVKVVDLARFRGPMNQQVVHDAMRWEGESIVSLPRKQ